MNKYSEKYPISSEIVHTVNDLINTALNPEKHIQVWANTLHLFPDKWKPPLLLDKTFDESNLKPEIVELLREGEVEIKKVSDQLYTLNISTETGELPDNALDLFEGSELQKLLK